MHPAPANTSQRYRRGTGEGKWEVWWLGGRMLVARCCDLPAAAVLSCSAPALCRPPARSRRRADETRSLLAGRSSRWVGPGVVGLRVLSNLPPLENMFGPGASINRPKKIFLFPGNSVSFIL
jgi:hypothetical protein